MYEQELKKLIDIKTVQGNEEEFAKIREILPTMFPHLFNQATVEYFDGSLLIKWEGKNHDHPILFMNHHDVVSENGKWEHSPFNATIENGKLYGRGAIDNKGGFYCMLKAADELIASDFTPAQDIYFESSCDEETTSLGADHISNVLKERNIHFDFCLDEGGAIMDNPISLAKGRYAMVGVGEKGCANLNIIARSNGGHASTPEKNSPLVRLSKFIQDVDNHKVFDVCLSDTVCELFRRLSKNSKGLIKLIIGHPRFFKPMLKALLPSLGATTKAMVMPTLAFTKALASDEYNVMPTVATIGANLRYSHHQGLDSCVNALNKYAKKYDLEIEVTDPGFPSNVTNFNSNEFEKLTSAIKAIYPTCEVVPYIANGATDARFYSRVCDNCLRVSPFLIDEAQLESIHAPEESINIDCLEKGIFFYKTLMGGLDE